MTTENNVHWSYTRSVEVATCATKSLFFRAWRPSEHHAIGRTADHHLPGVLTHRLLQLILENGMDHPCSELRSWFGPQHLGMCIEQCASEYAAANDGMVIPGRVVARAREMVREGGRLLRSIYPAYRVAGVELSLTKGRMVGEVDLLFQHPSQNEFLIIDWKTRDSQPVMFDNPQLATYHLLVANMHPDARISAALALVHPNRKTVRTVRFKQQFLASMEERMERELAEWDGWRSALQAPTTTDASDCEKCRYSRECHHALA